MSSEDVSAKINAKIKEIDGAFSKAKTTPG